MSNQPQIKLYCGLGNPEDVAPADSLHNLGFMAVDHFRANFGASTLPPWEPIDGALVLKLADPFGDFYVAKPLHVSINESGVPIRSLSERFRLHASQILIVHDDVDLELGKIRLATGDRHPRHNGIKSIRKELESDAFFQAKGGVGRPLDKSASLLEWVKNQMSPVLLDPVRALATRLSDSLKAVRTVGFVQAQDRFNRKVQ